MNEQRLSEPSHLASSARRGVAVNMVATIVRNGLDIVTSIVLARLLLPEEFGMVAVITVFIGLSWVVGNLGMGGAVIQAHSLTDTDKKVAFTISIAVGSTLTLMLAVSSPLLAGYFDFPVLRAAMPVMSLQMALASAESTSSALLRRKLHFGRLAIVTLSGGVAYSTTAIGLAVLEYGLWSLVWAPVVAAGVSLLISILLAGFRPGISLSKKSIRKLLGYGSTLTAKNIVVYLSRQADKFLVPKFLGAHAAGLYSRAFNYSSIPDARMIPLLSSVCFPIFSKLRFDRDRLLDWYEKISVTIAVGAAPVLVGLCVTAEDFTLALFGSKWHGMVETLRILSIAGLFTTLHKLGGAAIEASGRLRFEIVILAIYAVLVTVGSFVGVHYGIEAVGWAVLLANLALFFMKGAALRAAIGLPLQRYFGSVVPSVGAATVMAVGLYLAFYQSEPWWIGASAWPNWLRLTVAIPVGASIYLITLWLLGRRHFELVAGELKNFVQPAFRHLA